METLARFRGIAYSGGLATPSPGFGGGRVMFDARTLVFEAPFKLLFQHEPTQHCGWVDRFAVGKHAGVDVAIASGRILANDIGRYILERDRLGRRWGVSMGGGIKPSHLREEHPSAYGLEPDGTIVNGYSVPAGIMIARGFYIAELSIVEHPADPDAFVLIN